MRNTTNRYNLNYNKLIINYFTFIFIIQKQYKQIFVPEKYEFFKISFCVNSRLQKKFFVVILRLRNRLYIIIF